MRKSSSNRPLYYDRNSTVIQKVNTSTNIGPHASTQRWSYTVPANRSCKVSQAMVKITRITAASSASRVDTGIAVASGPFVVRSEIFSNGVGDKDSMNVGDSAVLVATNQVIASDEDLSTGGAIDTDEDFVGVEFDA